MLVLFACVAAASAAEPETSPAPNFALPSVEGGNERLSEYRGSVVVLEFWSSRCADCDAHLRRLQALVARHRDAGARLVVVSIDRHADHAAALAAALQAPVLLDVDRRVAREYDLGKLPVTHLVDFHGRLRTTPSSARRAGVDEIEAQLRSLLGE